jgi:hypothetical protein
VQSNGGHSNVFRMTHINSLGSLPAIAR